MIIIDFVLNRGSRIRSREAQFPRVKYQSVRSGLGQTGSNLWRMGPAFHSSDAYNMSPYAL